jgi:hypothetical protein
MWKGSQERSPQKLAKCRRDYLAQAMMLTVDGRTQEAAEINKALGIKAPGGTAAAASLATARAAYIRLLGSLGSNACQGRGHAFPRAARSNAVTDAGP